MATDIMNDLTNTLLNKYADSFKIGDSFNKIKDDIISGMKEALGTNKMTNDGYFYKGNNKESQQQRSTYNDIIKNFNEEENLLKKQFALKKSHEAELAALKAKYHITSSNQEEQLAKKTLNDYKKLYEYQFDEKRKYYKQLDEEESKIYKDSLDSGKKLTDNQLAQLKIINNKRKEYINEEEREEKEKNRRKQLEADKFFNQLKNRVKNIDWKKIITDALNFGIDTYLSNQLKAGLTKYASAYEQNFTTIAGNTGYANRQQTHELITGVVSEINSTDYLKKGLNFNTDVFPEIVNATKQGFLGDEAQEVAVSNAIDKKIMPWLDTSSDTWVNMRYELSDEMLQSIKGQQLLLQETREGNRILQDGVVSMLLDNMQPTLLNIDANTTDFGDLSEQAQGIYSYYRQFMSKQDAMKVTNQVIDAYQDPSKALLNSNSTPAEKMMAMVSNNGGGPNEIIQEYMMLASKAIGMNSIGIGAFAGAMGINTGGWTRDDSTMRKSADYLGYQEVLDIISGNDEDAKQKYLDTIGELSNYVTATQSYDNNLENAMTNAIKDSVNFPHLTDVMEQGLTQLKEIRKILIGMVVTAGASFIQRNFFGNSGETGSNIFGKFYKGGQLMKGGGRAPAGGQYVMSGLSKGLIGGASIIGGTTGAVIGIKDTWDNTKAITTMSLDNKEQAKNTKDYEAYKKSLEDRQFNVRGSSIAGGVIGGVAGAGGGYLAGTAAGAAVGSIIPGLGTAVGAIVGGLIGVAGGYLGAKAGEAIGEAMNPFTNVLSDAAVESLDNLTILNQNWDNEVVERQNLVNSMKLASDEETKKRLLLDAGFDKNLVSMAKTSDALDNLAKSALSAAEDNSDLANAAEGLSVNLNNTAVSDVFGNLKDNFEKLSSKERQQKLSEVLSLTTMDSTKRESIQKDIDGSRGFANRTTMKNVEDILARIQSASDDKSVRSIAGNYDLSYDTLNMTYFNKLNDAIINKDKEAAIDAITMLKADKISGSDKSAWDTIKTNESYKKALENMDIDVKQYKLGSSYIPNDMLAILHAGERVLTANQNKEYTEELQTGNGSIIVNSIQDVVSAIQNQTKTIIDYLSTMNFNNSSGFKKMSMLPSMGNTKVTL